MPGASRTGRRGGPARRRAGLGLPLLLTLVAAPALAQNLAGVFDPAQMLNLHLEMSASDWATLQGDATETIEVPAQFYADGEAPILVSVRRKDADPIKNGTSYTKISLRIDMNEYVLGQEWHDLKKLSLENGDDQNVIREGFAWQVRQLATGSLGYGYKAGRAAWVRLYINGVDTGVYVNPEFRDERFFENRGLYVPDQVWLYEIDTDFEVTEWVFGTPLESANFEALCYSPFRLPPTCAPPADITADIDARIETQGLLTLMAAGLFNENSDALVMAGKNIFLADFQTGSKRRY